MSRDHSGPGIASRRGVLGTGGPESTASATARPRHSTFRRIPAGASAPEPAKPKKAKSDRSARSDQREAAHRRRGPKLVGADPLRPGQLRPARPVLPAVRGVPERRRRHHENAFAASSSSSAGRRSGRSSAVCRSRIRRGASLEEAMAREPQAFDPMFLSMIRVAEARGGVPETLEDARAALRGPPAADPPGALGDDLPGHRPGGGRRVWSPSSRSTCCRCSRRPQGHQPEGASSPCPAAS